MNKRIEEAARLGARGGGLMALWTLPAVPAGIIAAALYPNKRWEAILIGTGAPIAAFAFYFLILFSLGAAFPFRDGRFQGARKVVWPLVALLIFATFWLALHGR